MEIYLYQHQLIGIFTKDKKTIEIKKIDETKLVDYSKTEALNIAVHLLIRKKIKKLSNIKPVEMILNDKEDKIIAIVTNSNSIIPIKPAENRIV